MSALASNGPPAALIAMPLDATTLTRIGIASARPDKVQWPGAGGAPMILRQIEAFQAVIEQGTFSAAAAVIRVSQPTISKLIQSLERALGYTLFQRTGSRVVPTPRALALYHEVHRAWRGLDRLTSTAQTLHKPAAGHLLVGADPTLALGFVPKLLAMFTAAQTGVDLTLECENGRILAEALRTGTIDIGFITRSLHAPPADGLSGQAVVSGETVCVLPADHRLANTDVLHPDDLEDEAFIGLLSGPEARRLVDQLFDHVSRRPRVVAEATTGLAACMLAAERIGVSLVPDLSAAAALQAGAAIVARPFRPIVPYTIEYAFSKAAHDQALPAALARLSLERGGAIHGAIVQRWLGNVTFTAAMADPDLPHAASAD
ncbi:MAG TPA: LysR substrate-binding domain-containing protein [Vineibacter sp.]|nr:LysR substrate-binding domain-containing protein [Vineibacter sp.]